MDYCLISGGAIGADSIFEKCAGEYQHKKIIYTVHDVDKSVIKEYDNLLKYINDKFLHRKYPTRNEYIKKRYNYWFIC